jgi:crossover junction endodeoxyribonuclease RuvC
MLVLGIDPSLTCTGWAVLKLANEPQYISSGVIKTSPKDEFYTRLKTISQSINSVLNTFAVEKIILEETIVNANASSSLKLGIVRGVIMCECLKTPAIMHEIKPSNVKKLITGNGSADKQAVDKMLKLIINNLDGTKFLTDDESDAVAVAFCLNFIL